MKDGIPNRSKLSEIMQRLIHTAMGRIKADMVIKNCNLINVYTGEILENTDIAIKHDRIALIGKADHTIGKNTIIIDAENKYAAPGFLDGHIHVESTMLTITEFSKTVIPRGTTSIFIDPHEIANVLGVKGIELFIEEAKNTPLKVFICIPSCVPATKDEFETSGAKITAEDIKEMIKWREVIGLAEVMNYPGVIQGNKEVLDKIKATIKLGKIVEGHAPKVSKSELCAYTAAGITSCHETTSKEEGIEKLQLGLTLMIREGSAWKDLSEVIKVITEEKLNSRRILLVSDDRHPEDLIREGHMDYIVKRAIEEGVDPIEAIQMATINTAEHYKLDLHLGGLAPPRYADILLINNIEKISIGKVIIDGKIVAENGKMIIPIRKYEYPKYAKKTIKVKRKINRNDFKFKVKDKKKVKIRVIKIKENSILTEQSTETMEVEEGEIKVNLEKDIIKISVIERHKATGNMSLGFVKGFGIKSGAAASTVAHDSHNIIVIGVSEEDMAKAVNKLIEIGGGMIVVKDGKLLALVELPVAGLISEDEAEVVCRKIEKLKQAWKELECKIKSPFMTMSILALPVIPELRITDKGLIDVTQFKKVSVLMEN